MLDDDEVQRRLGYHPATEATAPAFEMNRSLAILVGEVWNRALPAGREAALALTALQEALLWANAAVACNAGPDWQLEPIDVSTFLDDVLEHLEGPLHIRSRLIGSGAPVAGANGAELGPIREDLRPGAASSTPRAEDSPVAGAVVRLEHGPATPAHCLANVTIGTGVRACDLEAGHDGQHEGTDGEGRVEVAWS